MNIWQALMRQNFVPGVNLGQDVCGLLFAAGGEVNIVYNPVDYMILECAFDQLMKQIGREELMYVATREVACEWLREKHQQR